MADILSHLERLTAGDGRAVMATLLATEGARPRRPGAKLLVAADGATVGSVTLGGCVEARVSEAAHDVLASGRARLERIDLAAEEAYDLGLSCAATLELLIEPVLPSDRSASSLPSAACWLRDRMAAGHSGALVVRLDGSTARLGVLDDGTTHGSLGSPTLDQAAVSLAQTALARRASTVAAVPDLDVRVFIDVFRPVARLCVFGVGPVTLPLLRFARELDMHTVVVAARERRNDTPAVSDAHEVHTGQPGVIAGRLRIGRGDAVVILSHDYKYEIPVLEVVLRGDAGYIGLLGSRRRGAAVRGLLAERGLPADALERVRVPAGLDLGAEAPAEIALSILAEIMVQRTAKRP